MMHLESSSIYYRCEFEFLPIEGRRFGESFVRNLYARLSELGGHPYMNLDLQSEPPMLSTRRETDEGVTELRCMITSHSITFDERGPSVGVVPNATDAAKTILRAVQDVVAERQLRIPPLVLQKTQIEMVVRPEHLSPLKLLAGKATNVYSAVGPFRRPPSYFGIRFRFHPVELSESNSDDEWVQQSEDELILRYETYSQDPDCIWVEITSTRLPLVIGDLSNHLEQIADNVVKTYNYLQSNCIEFLNQFDIVDEDDDEENDEHNPDLEDDDNG